MTIPEKKITKRIRPGNLYQLVKIPKGECSVTLLSCILIGSVTLTGFRSQ